jgi:hypothetical protein
MALWHGSESLGLRAGGYIHPDVHVVAVLASDVLWVLGDLGHNSPAELGRFAQIVLIRSTFSDREILTCKRVLRDKVASRRDGETLSPQYAAKLGQAPSHANVSANRDR